jgi:CheY-like chemotaxis protein
MTRTKILLVDDNNDDIFLTRKALESKNCEVVSATSVTECSSPIFICQSREMVSQWLPLCDTLSPMC